MNACVQLYLTLMLLGFVTVVYRLFDLCVRVLFLCVRVWMIYIEVIVVSLEFHAKFMLHSNISNFQQSNRFLELLLRALGVQILRYYFEYLDRGPNTSK